MAPHKVIILLSSIISFSLFGYLYKSWTAEPTPSVNNTCVYPNLDLTPLAGQLIQCPLIDNPSLTLQFTPCISNQACNVFDQDTYMATELNQISIPNSNHTHHVHHNIDELNLIIAYLVSHNSIKMYHQRNLKLVEPKCSIFIMTMVKVNKQNIYNIFNLILKKIK